MGLNVKKTVGGSLKFPENGQSITVILRKQKINLKIFQFSNKTLIKIFFKKF